MRILVAAAKSTASHVCAAASGFIDRSSRSMASALLRLPPNSSVSLALAVNYERYGNVPAWSHAQLSIVGYSDAWLWEQAALGTGGENICFG